MYFKTETKSLKNRIATLAIVLLSLVIPMYSNAAGMLIADGGFGGALDIKNHDVRVTINNGIAVTHVEQTFVNKENRIVEALYTFPVPKGASVANFSMWINGKEMVGEVVEKERARKIYESYKQTKRDPGLLEQTDYKTFEMRIFPIPAKGEQRVQVTYYQELDSDHNWSSWVYPLATTTRKGIDQRVTGRFSLTLEAYSEVPIAKMQSDSHPEDFVMLKHSDNYYQASLEVHKGDIARDVVLAYKATREKTGMNLIASNHKGEDGYFQLSMTVGKELETLDTGMDYIFLLDISGSMANGGKLAMSRESIGAFISSLGEKDRFDLMTFNVSPVMLNSKLTEVKPETINAAINHLHSVKAKGGTILRPALDAAYRFATPDRPLNVVILSDGMTEQREQRELVNLIQRKPENTRVFCVGVGNEVNRPLLQQLAEESGGLAAFISEGDNFKRQAEAFRRKLTRPAVSNIKLTFEGGNVYDLTPADVPNLYHGSPIRIYGRYARPGKTKMTVKGEVLGSAFVKTIEVDLPVSNDQNPEIDRMWAYKRVDELLRQGRKNGSLESVKSEIVRLCEGYSIVSEYASFIVLENDAEYQRWQIDRRNATRIKRDRNAQARLRQQLDKMREQALSQVGPEQEQKAKPAVAPVTANPTTTRQAPANRPARTQPRQNNGWSFDVPTGGGGAIDPLAALLMVAFGSISWLAAQSRAEDQA